VPEPEGTDEADSLTVVIAAYNGEDTIGRLVRAALASSVVTVVLVVDNASRDGSAGIARELGAEVVPLEENRGYGGACNEGLARCTTHWVAFCNQDIQPEDGMFAELLDVALALRVAGQPDVIVAPKLQSSHLELAETAHRLPSWRRQAVELLFGERAAGARNVLGDGGHGDAPVRVGWVSAACIVGPVAALRAQGGFDASYFMYVEDVDLFQRWQARGLPAYWVPKARAVHSGGRRPISGALYARALSNWVRYFGRTEGAIPAIAIAASGIVGAAARGALWATRRRHPDGAGYRRMFLGGAAGAVRLEAGMLRAKLREGRGLKRPAPEAERPRGRPG
jgi:N-acetylglucosaminyl-diphospho-decaprenol L-rhamnosyltransferase